MAGLAFLTASNASADICKDLRTELRMASEIGPGTSAQARRYADAAASQLREIEKTRAIQSAQGCFRDPSASCQSLNRTIQRMTANLDALERQLDRLSGPRYTARVRAIELQIERSGCNAPQRIARTEPVPRSVTVLPEPAPRAERKSRIIVREGIGRTRLYDPTPETTIPSTGFADPIGPNEITIARMPGTFRTLCVRTCDGYYFPVSYSTRFDFLQRDAQACESMCPATEAKLFFHRVPDQESEDMISLQGRPYSALPNAFLYRKRSARDADPSCTCGTPNRTARAPAETEDQTVKPQAVPTPSAKPGNGIGADKTAIAPDNSDPSDPDEPPAEVEQTAEAKDPPPNVRVVGPEFLPAPEEAIDLRSPAPTNGL